MKDYVILVDEQDQEIGFCEKLEAHQKDLLHRAFSIFVFDWKDYKLLLHRRALGKYHSGGLWTNACCSHPRKGETWEESLRNRMRVELNFDREIHVVDPQNQGLLLDGADVVYSCGSFKYLAPFGELSEHEIDHVFLYSPVNEYFFKEEFQGNEEEIAELKWVTIKELNEWMKEKPEDFTAWFKKAYELAYAVLCRQARNIDMFRENKN